jgi:hypothetical protein
LVREIRLDHHAGAVAVGDGVGVRLDLFEKPALLQHSDDALPGLETVEAAERENRVQVG